MGAVKALVRTRGFSVVEARGFLAFYFIFPPICPADYGREGEAAYEGEGTYDERRGKEEEGSGDKNRTAPEGRG